MWRLCRYAAQQVLMKFILEVMPVNNPHDVGERVDRVGRGGNRGEAGRRQPALESLEEHQAAGCRG